RSTRRPAPPPIVTATSSNDGWRHSSWALSAPAYPEAPRTATSGTQLTPGLPLQGVGDRGAALGHLVVGQCAVGRAKLEREGERDAPLPHLLSTVDVEHLRPAQQSAAGLAHDLPHALGGHVVGDNHRDVLSDRREAGDV